MAELDSITKLINKEIALGIGQNIPAEVPNYREVDCCSRCSHSDEQDLFSGMSGSILVCTKYDFNVEPTSICDSFRAKDR